MGAHFNLILFGLFSYVAIQCNPKTDYGVAVSNLTCEYLENPISMDMQSPRLSWILISDGKNKKQTAYHILTATNPEILQKDSFDLWNTGKIISDQSIQIKYAGEKLKSGMCIYLTVRIWDELNQPTSWSSIAFWEMSLLNASDWQAKWISSKIFQSGDSLN